MLEAIDLPRLLAWLEERNADPAVLRYAAHDLMVAEPEHHDDLDLDQCGLLLAGLLLQACDPRVEANRVDALEEVAFRLGFDDEELGSFLRQTLRITMARLRGYATLNLPLGASKAEIKSTHRALIKVFHPDRHPMADAATQVSAGRMLARLNEARATLLRPFEDEVLEGEDDVWLDEPVFEAEDAPTEDYTGDALMLG
jgi:DnaJ-domain-containing protein 1